MDLRNQHPSRCYRAFHQNDVPPLLKPSFHKLHVRFPSPLLVSNLLIDRGAAPLTTHLIQKFNSTSSLYIKDTLQAPDLDEITWWYDFIRRLVLPPRSDFHEIKFLFMTASVLQLLG